MLTGGVSVKMGIPLYINMKSGRESLRAVMASPSPFEKEEIKIGLSA